MEIGVRILLAFLVPQVRQERGVCVCVRERERQTERERERQRERFISTGTQSDPALGFFCFFSLVRASVRSRSGYSWRKWPACQVCSESRADDTPSHLRRHIREQVYHPAVSVPPPLPLSLPPRTAGHGLWHRERRVCVSERERGVSGDSATITFGMPSPHFERERESGRERMEDGGGYVMSMCKSQLRLSCLQSHLHSAQPPT